MSRASFRGRGRIALVAGAVSLIALLATRAEAQGPSPVIIPGLPGANLQAGTLPRLTVWPYTDLPGGKAIAPSDEEEPGPLPYGVTGNWFGARDNLFDDGIDLRTNVSQFYQGVTGGGLHQGFPYGLKLDYFGTIEFEKLIGWEGLFVNLHAESRFGDSVNPLVGSMIPANFAMEFPKPQGAASALTNMSIEQFLGENWVVTFGKFNQADGVNLHPFLGGNGINRFMNEAFVLSPIYAQTLNYSVPGAGFSYLRNLDPILTFFVVDPTGRADTPGLQHLFNNGVSMFTQLRLPVTPFGLPGHQMVEGTYATGRFSPLSQEDLIILNRPAGVPGTLRSGSWVVTYGFDQFLVVDEKDPTKGWGMFGNISLANNNTNPVRWFMNLGIAGQSPFQGRPADSWGLGYYYLGTSSVLRQTLGDVAPKGNEQGFEWFYNFAITSWFTVTTDIQSIDPALHEARSAFLFGLRAKIDF
jgi:porin